MYGLKYDMYLPSGEILKSLFSGDLKKALIGISDASCLLQWQKAVIITIKSSIVKYFVMGYTWAY
jgi:hypothetical protein